MSENKCIDCYYLTTLGGKCICKLKPPDSFDGNYLTYRPICIDDDTPACVEFKHKTGEQMEE